MKKLIFTSMLSAALVMSLSVSAKSTTPEQRIEKAGFVLPQATTPIGNYVTWRLSGKTLYLSGHGACEGKSVLGKLGDTLNAEQGYKASQQVALCALSTIKSAVGDLSKVKQVLQISGMVNATSTFTDHPKVINGFSDIFVTAFGEDGKAARAAVGMSSLPANWAVEISAVIELK